MANKIGKYIYIILLLIILGFGINNKAALSEESLRYPEPESNADIYKLVAVLPDGWRYKINTSNLGVTMFTEETPKFTLTINDPSITCEKEIRYKQYAAVTPGITLYFHDKWDISKWAAFDKQVTKLHHSAESVLALVLFIETDKYTVFTYGRTDCPEKPIQEIEAYWKGYLKKYNDFGVTAIVRAIKEDEIKTAVFFYQFEQSFSGMPQDIKVCFLSLGAPVLENMPTDYFLKRFQKQPIAVKKVSQCKVNVGVKDKKTGLKGKICQVRDIKWIKDTEVEVSGGIYFGLLSAKGYIYYVVWENDQWIVKEAKLVWES